MIPFHMKQLIDDFDAADSCHAFHMKRRIESVIAIQSCCVAGPLNGIRPGLLFHMKPTFTNDGVM